MAEPLRMTCIYALFDPETLQIRYVGKSNDPKKRFQAHLSRRSLGSDNARNRWLKSLLARGVKPFLGILQVVPDERWAEAERAWICILRMQGCDLLNTSDGGEGVLEQDYPTPKPLPPVPPAARSRPRLTPRPPAAPRPAAAPRPNSGVGGPLPQRPRAPRRQKKSGR